MVSAAHRGPRRADALKELLPTPLTSQGSQAPEKFRLFLAVAIPEGVRAELERTQLEFRRAAIDLPIRWTKPEHFHLTLKFLGDVEVERIEALSDALRTVSRNFEPLQLRVQEIGCFPDWHYPRVIWAGVQDPTQTLLRLQSATESAAQPFSAEEREKNFAGHVTLGRVKGIRRAQAEVLARFGASMSGRFFGEWCASNVMLMRSELGSDGARHTVLAELGLVGL